MPITTHLTYTPPEGKLTPEYIPLLIADFKECMRELTPFIEERSPREVLEILEKSSYSTTSEQREITVDVTAAKKRIKAYREGSEGGCRSCIHLGRETLDAQDADSGWYCKISDPDYDEKAIGKSGVRYKDFSPKIKKHYDTPCEDWDSSFSKTIDQILEEMEAQNIESDLN